MYDRLKNQLAAIDSIAESAAAAAGSQDEAKAALKNISLEISDLGTTILQNHKQEVDDSISGVEVGGASGGVAPTKKAATILDECIICLERKPGQSLNNLSPYFRGYQITSVGKMRQTALPVVNLLKLPDTILPCAHSYCLPCIEQWNVDHKTCPVCRETLASTNEGWVISDGPDALEIATDIQKALMNLTQ